MLKYVASVTGVAIIAPLLGCSEKVLPIITPAEPLLFFTPENFKVLTQLIDVILPKTDSPSASDVKVNYIMDQLLGRVFDHEYRNKFSHLFAQLTTYLDQNNFSELSASKQTAFLTALETLPEEQRNNAFWAYIDIKQQTVVHYLSTEEIAKNHLNYLPIPGPYKPCVPVEELGGKAWAI